ncbi:MAG: UDP-N-acetylmuramate dehydrogenase [Clostridia bacterium]
MDKMKMKKRLTEKISGSLVQENAPMAKFTSFRAGGCADLLVQPQNIKELQDVLQVLQEEGCPHMVLGNGSNVLVKDGGYRGVIVKLGSGFDHVTVEGNVIRCGSGALLSAVAKAAADAGLTGMECLSGIPEHRRRCVHERGAYGGEIKDVLRKVSVISQDGAHLSELDTGSLDLGYRHSILQQTGDIVLEAEFMLQPGNETEIKEKMAELKARRNEKQPVNYPSAGSFFKRPEGYFAGKLVQDADLKGVSVGGAEVSQLHSGFLINKGGATATDIIQLMRIVQAAVMERFGVMLEPEVRIIGEE